MDGEKPVYDIRQRTYDFAVETVRLTRSLPRDAAGDVIGKQLLRAATSVGANVAEAQGSASKRDFATYYRHALRSANETKFWLCLLRDACNTPDERVPRLLNEANQLANILAASVLSIRKSRSF